MESQIISIKLKTVLYFNQGAAQAGIHLNYLSSSKSAALFSASSHFWFVSGLF